MNTALAAQARQLQGVLLLILATACFVVLDSSIKYLSASVSVLLAVWFRYLFQAVATTAVVLPTRGRSVWRTAHPWQHLLRGLLLLLTSAIGVLSLKFMPVGEFTAIIMLTPLAVTLLAAIFLHEQVSPLRWLLVAGGFTGALLVVQPGNSDMGWKVLLPLSGVAVYALFQILTSRMARTEDPITMHLYTGWVGTLIMTAALPWLWHPIPNGMGLWLFVAGLMGSVGHFVLILAFARAPAATLAPYLYAQIGFAMLAGWLVFDHVPGPLELLGIALIVVCGASGAWLAARSKTPPPG